MEMYEICCSGCSVIFSIPKSFEERLRETGEVFYCPKGCKQSFGKEKNSALKGMEMQRDGLISQRNRLQRSLSATQGVVTKLKNKIERLKSK